MWKGLKKALGKPGKLKKCSLERYALDSSTRSTSSAAPSVVFPLDLADADAVVAWHDQQQQHAEQEQQLPHIGLRAGGPAGPDPLTASQIQQHLQQQLVVQQLMQRTDDHSASKRQAAALQKRIDNQMLNPSTCLYQISSLLSLSTLFEHKLQRDAMTALRQVPGSLVTNAAAAAAAANADARQQLAHSTSNPHWACEYSGNSASSDTGSCCGCVARTPSATAASTAHVALQLARWGYRVIVRKVLHSKAYWTKSMDNTFIVALDTSSGSHVEYVVDPHFRETFNVGVMSANYSAVWHSLPQVFVGMPCQLQPVVQLLCEEMELSFLEAGRPCPPWREWAATINRWMSDQYVDILVPEPGAADEEVVEFITRCCQFNSVPAGTGGISGASTTSVSTTSTCSPVNLNQQRLQDKMHVSSVLSSASTSSKRQVPEPLHKQLGFNAVMEDDAAGLLPATLRDASFTSLSSDASAESVQMLTEAQAAANAAEAAKRPQLGVVARSFSIPSAEILSSSSGSSADSGSCLAEGEFAVALIAAAMPAGVQQQQLETTNIPQGSAAACPPGAAEAQSGGCSTDSCADNKVGQFKAAGQQPKKQSLLTAHMQLKAQQQQQRALFLGAGPVVHLPLQVVPQLQQQQQRQAPQPQQEVQALQQQQQLLQQLQLQHQQMLHQHIALQQIQQHQLVYPQQLASLQQQCAQPAQKPAVVQAAFQQQQPLVAPLLPVVHTVRPCGAAPAAVSQPAAAVAAQGMVNQSMLLQQQQLKQPLFNAAQLLAIQGPVQEQQPRLLRLIQRHK